MHHKHRLPDEILSLYYIIIYWHLRAFRGCQVAHKLYQDLDSGISWWWANLLPTCLKFPVSAYHYLLKNVGLKTISSRQSQKSRLSVEEVGDDDVKAIDGHRLGHRRRQLSRWLHGQEGQEAPKDQVRFWLTQGVSPKWRWCRLKSLDDPNIV